MTSEADRLLVGVGVVIVEDERILMIKRGKPPGKGLWAVPGGKVKFGEGLKTAARREALEETGLTVEVHEVVWVGEVMDAERHMVLIDFRASVVSGRLAADDDADDAAWISLDETDSVDMTPTMYPLIETLRK